LWNTFFEELGFEVVVSRPANRNFVEEGFKFADDDTCLPIKMAYSHTLYIKDQVDCLFIPRLIRMEPATYFCPRMAGLPEMLQYSIPDLPLLLTPYVDERYRSSRLFKSFSKMASALGKRSKEIKEAYRKGEVNYRVFRERMGRGERVKELFPKPERENLTPQMKIAVVGHPYCLYDPYFNFNILKILEEADVSIHLQERVSREDIDNEVGQFKKDIYWSFGREILGASLHYLHSNQVDGLIYLTCFACGVDSMIEPLVRCKAKEDGRVLYLCLMIDEHTSAGGVQTRMEAFLETIGRRKSHRRIA
jgi:predicted nucleotide-binding protein (sugar kinase/HSP70/actin superfamily)